TLIRDRFREDLQATLNSLFGFTLQVQRDKARGYTGTSIVNTYFIGPAGHVLALDLMRGNARKHSLPQNQVMKDLFEGVWTSLGGRRNSVTGRAIDLSPYFRHVAEHLYQVQHLEVGSDLSWDPEVTGQVVPAPGQTASTPRPKTWPWVLSQSKF